MTIWMPPPPDPVFGTSTPARSGWFRMFSGVSPTGTSQSFLPVFMSMATSPPKGL